MEQIRGFLRSQPFWIDGVLLTLVCIHLFATSIGWIPDIWTALADPKKQIQAQDIYLGMLGPSAIIAGFAGVVVVFGLTASTERFKRFRVQAGRSLRRTWSSTSMSGFVSVALAVVAALCGIAELFWLAPYVFEACLLLFAHGAIRLVWILSQMIGIVRADDVVDADRANTFKLSSLPQHRFKEDER